MDPIHDEVVHWRFESTTDVNNQSVISELWTGDWWREEQAKAGQENILVIILYSDETSTSFAGKSVNPIYMSLGNLPMSFRNHISGKRLLGFLPTIKPIKAFRQDPDVHRFRKEVQSQALQSITIVRHFFSLFVRFEMNACGSCFKK